MISCTNCKTELPQTSNYCFVCGQNTQNFHRPFLTFLKDSLHEMLDIDGRLMLTVKTLLLKPGLAAYEFDQGKRSKYTPPLRLYLVASVIFFLVFASFQHVFSGGEQNPKESVTELYSRIMFLLFPIYALIVGCVYKNSYFISNLVFSMHMHTVAYIALIFIGALEAAQNQHVVFLWLQIPPSLYVLWYVLNAFKTMYQESWLKTILKAAATYFVYMMALGFVFDYLLR